MTNKLYYTVGPGDKLYRHYKGKKLYIPFIKASTYNKYYKSRQFQETLRRATNAYILRCKNERKQMINLSGKTKDITIKGRGTYKMPIEIFNKIQQACKAAGVDVRLGLAIAIKESSGYTDPSRVNSYYWGNSGKNWIKGKAPNAAGPSTIVSNWQYFENSPYIGLLKGWERSGWNSDRVEKDADWYYTHKTKEYTDYDNNINEDVLVNMFKLPLEKINSGEAGYASTIKLYMKNMSFKSGGILSYSTGSSMFPVYPTTKESAKRDTIPTDKIHFPKEPPKLKPYKGYDYQENDLRPEWLQRLIKWMTPYKLPTNGLNNKVH